MAGEGKSLFEELKEMRREHREDHQKVMGLVHELSALVAQMNAEGCGQAWQHQAVAKDLRELKADVVSLRESRAEGRGRGAVVAIMVSAVVSVLVGAVVGFFKKGA